MRCNEAKRRLTGSRRNGSEPATDPELVDHLRTCPNCSRQAKAAQTLRRMLTSARAGDTVNTVPFSEMKRQIEVEVAARRSKQPQRAAKSNIRYYLRRRPAAVFGALTAVCVMVTLSLIPFRYDQTIGYEVAFAGVQKELAEDNERICDLLFELGLVEADVDILGCDTTCNLQIIHLKSEQEVQLVVTALTNMNSLDLSTVVIPVRTSATGSLLERASERIL